MDESTKNAIEFLTIARALELKISGLQDVAYRFQSTIEEILNKEYPKPCIAIPENEMAFPFFGIAGAMLGGALGFAAITSIFEPGVVIVVIPTVLISAYFGAATFSAIGAWFQKKRGEQTRKKQQAIAEEQWQQETKDAKAKDMILARSLEDDYLTIVNSISICHQMLAAHYKDGPLAYEYQNLDAVCRILRYLETNRCDSLGAAYNLYGTEKYQESVLNNQRVGLQNQERIIHGINGIANNMMLHNDNVDSQFESIKVALDGIGSDVGNMKYEQQMSAVRRDQVEDISRLLMRMEDYNRYNGLNYRLRSIDSELKKLNRK